MDLDPGSTVRQIRERFRDLLEIEDAAAAFLEGRCLRQEEEDTRVPASDLVFETSVRVVVNGEHRARLKKFCGDPVSPLIEKLGEVGGFGGIDRSQVTLNGQALDDSKLEITILDAGDVVDLQTAD